MFIHLFETFSPTVFGLCYKICGQKSDNAPQFKLVQTVLDREWSKVFKDEDVRSFLSLEGIVWKFTTALAPWIGGFYERLVGLVKQSLRK